LIGINDANACGSYRGLLQVELPTSSCEAETNVIHPGCWNAAPDFTLRVTPHQNRTLSDLRGKPVILAFYPADWSPVCGDQVTLYNEILPEFHKHDAELLGISVDGVWCHAAFARDRRLHFPLLADFEPKAEVARKYRAYRASEGVCERALFVLDRRGTITCSYCSPIAVNPGADGILDASKNSQTRQTHMATLKVPVTQNDHIRGPANADHAC
jgi:peroxiredoxin